MFSCLKNQLFAVEAYFKSSTVLTFAVPKEQLENLLPPCLALDVFDNKWAFVAVAMVQTTELRPKGFPKFLGNDFFLIGYRIFVRYTNTNGKRLRGLYILKSETDKKKMEYLGNIFTHYNYSTTDISQIQDDTCTRITSKNQHLRLLLKTPNKKFYYLKTRHSKIGKKPEDTLVLCLLLFIMISPTAHREAETAKAHRG